MAWKGCESPKHGAPEAVLGGQSAALERVSVGLWNIKPLQNTSMWASPLPACQSFLINPLAGASAAVPTSVLSCLPTASMSSHKIKSNYQQAPAPCSPHRACSSTSGFHNLSRGAQSCSSSTGPSALLSINLLCPFPPVPPPIIFHFDQYSSSNGF